MAARTRWWICLDAQNGGDATVAMVLPIRIMRPGKDANIVDRFREGNGIGQICLNFGDQMADSQAFEPFQCLV